MHIKKTTRKLIISSSVHVLCLLHRRAGCPPFEKMNHVMIIINSYYSVAFRKQKDMIFLCAPSSPFHKDLWVLRKRWVTCTSQLSGRRWKWHITKSKIHCWIRFKQKNTKLWCRIHIIEYFVDYHWLFCFLCKFKPPTKVTYMLFMPYSVVFCFSSIIPELISQPSTKVDFVKLKEMLSPSSFCFYFCLRLCNIFEDLPKYWKKNKNNPLILNLHVVLCTRFFSQMVWGEYFLSLLQM